MEIKAKTTLYLPEMLRPSDLSSIRERGVELGSHTVSHRNLAEIDPDAAREELTESVRWLRNLGEDVSVVAYPGDSYTSATMRLAREAGYSAGLAVGGRGVSPRDDLFGLPRFDITDRPAGMISARGIAAALAYGRS